MAPDFIAKDKRVYTPPGFYVPIGNDLRPANDHFRNFLTSNQHMPGGKKPTGCKKPTEDWKRTRVEVNLTIVFEAILHFDDFWGKKGFFRHLSVSLNYGSKQGPKLSAMIDAYCDARSAFLQQQKQGHEACPDPGSRLVELADHFSELREQPERVGRESITTEVWARRMESWKQRLQEVIGELEVLYALQLKEDQASSTSPAPSHVAGIDPNGKHQSSSGNGADDKPDNVTNSSTPFSYDVSGKNGEVSGTKRGLPDDDTSFGNLPKRPTLDTDVARRIWLELPDTGSCIVLPGEIDDGTHKHCDPSDCKIARLFLPPDPLEALQVEHGIRIGKIETQQTDLQEEMIHKIDIHTKEAAARLEAFQGQLKTMQDQLQVQQAALANHTTTSTDNALSNGPAPSADSRERDLSELTAREPKEFIKVICEELSKLRAAAKTKIHQMDKQGLPDDENKLAVSDLSWQIGKCIKVAEKGVGELM
ncbi:uncharacterized protein PG986_001936 [Apiospora aurea]|uniref:Uncharacterized protein n=1 Tax=Apiospora aurea TaxID=335848 RepID=A0ABR1QYF0_9PEZI